MFTAKCRKCRENAVKKSSRRIAGTGHAQVNSSLYFLIAGSVLTSMGMVMLPPTMVSTPIKLLLFVLADGWALLTRSLVASFL